MSTPFRQYTPAELYIGIDNPEPVNPEGDEGQPTEKKNGFRSTGCDFIDIFLNNVYVYGIRTAQFHAKMLKIEPLSLRYTVQTLTGKGYMVFVSECILLMAEDLLNRNSNDLKTITNRLGFSTYSGFFRLMKRYAKRSPTGRKQPKPKYENLFPHLRERNL